MVLIEIARMRPARSVAKVTSTFLSPSPPAILRSPPFKPFAEPDGMTHLRPRFVSSSATVRAIALDTNSEYLFFSALSLEADGRAPTLSIGARSGNFFSPALFDFVPPVAQGPNFLPR